MVKGTSMFGLLGMEVTIMTLVLPMAIRAVFILLQLDLLIRMEDRLTTMKTVLQRWRLHSAIILTLSHHITITGTFMIRSTLLL